MTPILVYGPISACSCDTSSYFGIFKVLRLIERIKAWAQEKYWPWYCKAVIEKTKLADDVDDDDEDGDDEMM